MLKRMVTVLVLAAAAGGLGGCIAIGGSPTVQKPTVGQELVDLKTALDKGAITPAEYERQKGEILSRKN